MAGTGHNQEKQSKQQDYHKNLKYSYFHYNNNNNNNTSPVLLNKIPSSPSVCTSTHHQQTMISSSTSPWYHSSTPAGDNDDLSYCDGTNLKTMTKQSSSLSLK